MTKRNLLKSLIEIGMVSREPVKLRSGKISNFYCDIKKAYGYPDLLNAIANEIGQKLSKKVTCIAASGYGGLPLASVVAVKFNKRLILVRDKVKNHGRKKYIDGYMPNKADAIVIIDDVVTTGSSILSTINGLKSAGSKILNAIVVIKRDEPTLPISYSYLFTVDEILYEEGR